jgi:Endonuclease NucS C-terminal domain
LRNDRKLWKIYCQEEDYPGLWRQWYKNQCVAVGWNASLGYRLRGLTKSSQGWTVARKALIEAEIGDWFVVQLKKHRVGRVGEVIGKAINDDEWNPLVPASKNLPEGQMGRRILVRWDLTVGPDNKDSIIQLPDGTRFGPSELRPTICAIRSMSFEKLKSAMNDPANWVGLLSHFQYEKALSDYIATYPHHLEDGLVPYPSSKVREKVLLDKKRKKRSDVLLLDRKNTPVIVECKQESPTVDHVRQLQQYMRLLEKETGRSPRGILVHGGSRQLQPDVGSMVKRLRNVIVIQYRLDVDFALCPLR